MFFKNAKAIYLKDYSKDMNIQAGFTCEFINKNESSYVMNITGATFYRVYINGQFLHYGPARAAHNHIRMDKLLLDDYIIKGKNIVFIEVAGYYVSSYYTIKMPSFIQMEILSNDQVICYTGINSDIKGYLLDSRVQKTIRYSYQRTFLEDYYMNNNNNMIEKELCEVANNYTILHREVPIPLYKLMPYDKIIENGFIEYNPLTKDQLITGRHIDGVSDIFEGFIYKDVIKRPFEVIQNYNFNKEIRNNLNINDDNEIALKENQYVMFSMPINNVGFIRNNITALEDSEVYIIFDEKLLNKKIDIKSWFTANVVHYSLKKNDIPYQLESFESYGFKYILFMVTKGSISLNFQGIREYSCPDYTNTKFTCDDQEINNIFKASRETYRQNTLDVFMDCPTRERAGWLCDSYFTAQVEQYYSKKPIVEKVMLENYINVPSFPHLPKGMLPMCYPADHIRGNFLPQWALWFVIELENYFIFNPNEDKNKFHDLCYNLLDYFKEFENEFGLLESLVSWSFIEWSDANKFVQDIHYPTNMLYAKVLNITGNLFNDKSLLLKSKKIKEVIVKQSFNGQYFYDHAKRHDDNSIEILKDASEVCQYYSIFFGVSDLEDPKYMELKRLVYEVFGPNRKENKIREDIVYANAFIGNYLRMEILTKKGAYFQVIDEIIDYFSKMANITGTLWENDSLETGSLNHGFASYIGIIITKIILGIKKIDIPNKKLYLDFSYKEKAASGSVGTIYGDIVINREFIDKGLVTTYDVPEQFKVITIK